MTSSIMSTVSIKVITLILFAGMSACGLLAVRQQRIALAHDVAGLHRTLIQHQRDIQTFHVRLQDEISGDRIHQMIQQFEEDNGILMVPFQTEECLNACLPNSVLEDAITHTAESDLLVE